MSHSSSPENPADIRSPRPVRIVISGGPGSGKTSIIEALREAFGSALEIVPEAARILFQGGFPRSNTEAGRRAEQRAILHVQQEMEYLCWFRALEAGAKAFVCDRGTVDGAAYWPGSTEDFFRSMGTSQIQELGRYDLAVFLRTSPEHYEQGSVRMESIVEALELEDRLLRLWDRHSNLHIVHPTPMFQDKVEECANILRAALPENGAVPKSKSSSTQAIISLRQGHLQIEDEVRELLSCVRDEQASALTDVAQLQYIQRALKSLCRRLRWRIFFEELPAWRDIHSPTDREVLAAYAAEEQLLERLERNADDLRRIDQLQPSEDALIALLDVLHEEDRLLERDARTM